MSVHPFHVIQTPTAPQLAAPRRILLGQLLRQMGALSDQDLAKAVALQQREETRFGDILLAHGFVRQADLYAALALQYNTSIADLKAEPPDGRLIDRLGAEFCIRNAVLPWKRVGAATVLICSRPDEFEQLKAQMPESFGRLRMAIAPEEDIQAALVAARHRSLAKRAETRVADHESCRTWERGPIGRLALAALCALIALFFVTPVVGFAVLTGWAVLTLVLNSAIKAAAAITYMRNRGGVPAQAEASDITCLSRRRKGEMRKLPVVSVMVPLFHETEIAGRLVKRLSAISYPRELLDICLVVEEDDTLTQETIARSDLPRWMRQIIVPRGAVKTKPRALNFALDFCRGSIIGVYDAEDAPDADQIHKIAQRFAETGPEVACLQGVLDFYNAQTNWLSRCFTVEYAAWFRIILPGLEKLGFAVPLGGTTVFFRREALEELGGWDAYNVTEDADLGIRLARHGYRTELIHTVTQEEANCRVWPWVKQRSRWIKGYAMTWGVAMRDPRGLLRELGWWKFIGVQILFAGTLSQFVLAPVLWSFWALPLGLPHPLVGVMPMSLFLGLGVLFLASEVLNIAVGTLAVSGPKHRWLRWWVPTLHLYYPLASLAALKGLGEIMHKPFYWDKTVHGIFDTHEPDQTPGQDALSDAPNPPHPV